LGAMRLRRRLRKMEDASRAASKPRGLVLPACDRSVRGIVPLDERADEG